MRLITSFGVILFFTIQAVAQTESIKDSKRYSFSGGAGYFNCLPAGSSGTSIWIECAKRLRSGFNIAIKLQHSQANMELGHNWGFLEGQKKPDVFYVIDVCFSKPVNLGGNHFIELGIGFMYEKSYSWLPPLEIINNYVILRDEFGESADDLGLSFKLDYQYRCNDGFLIGFRVQSYYILGCFVEGLALTPYVGMRF
jgi:hypothetical protein